MKKQDSSGVELYENGVEPDAVAELFERQEAETIAKLGIYVVPVVIIHVALLLWVVRAATGFSLETSPHAGRIIAWLWVNGAALTLGVWMWRKDRFPIGAREWLQGKRARWAIVTWLGCSLAWFMMPAMVEEAWHYLLDLPGDW